MSKKRLLEQLPNAEGSGSSSYITPGSTPEVRAQWVDSEERQQLLDAAQASETGAVLFEEPERLTLVIPPFAVEEALAASGIATAPLVELLERPRILAVLLLRRGGYTIGFFRGDYLVVSKTDRRFVKNRHRKGGQSQRRFDRIREKQVHELLKKACEDGRATLEPYVSEVQRLYFGGDRLAVKELREECDYFDRTYGARISPRLLPVVGDPRRASLDAVPREVWSSDVWVFERA